MNSEKRRQQAAVLLSEMQQQTMLAGGGRLVTACPGAGKTRSVGARAAVLDADGLRVALVTYTNVAADEMRGTLARDYGARLADQHYVGTLHSFLLKYVFRPFSHLVMGCSVPPAVRVESGERFLRFKEHRLALDDFEFHVDSSLTFEGRYPNGLFLKRAALSEAMRAEATAGKVEEARSGVVQVDEAMYWCMLTLEKFPDVRSAVAARFDEIIVDEAQDTSGFQIECLRLIAGAGLSSLFLVGDFDQSIYEFKGASRKSCLGLASQIGLVEYRLTENHRSSQRICNVAANFRGLETPDSAVGPAANANIQPSVMLYEPERLALIPDDFSSYLKQFEISPSHGAVIARNNRLLDSLSGRPSRPGFTPSIRLCLDVARLDHQAPALRQLRNLEDLIVNVAFGEAQASRTVERSESLRDAAMFVVDNLPPSEGLLGEWVNSATSIIVSAAQLVGGDAGVRDRISTRLRISATNAELPLEEAVQPGRSDGLRLDTIHGVKGMSIGGVLLVVDHVERYDGALQADEWASAIRRQTESKAQHVADEELRIVYVALTRAERVCRLAIPSDTSVATLEAFRSVGFTVEGLDVSA
ncbi:ATP-dependent helicase [Kribbella lupini]|uniref:ATP-dependent helicase n=2 Tax=Kribbella lupini TaxID=291602 RepID=A0ABP4MS42_9ACTN